MIFYFSGTGNSLYVAQRIARDSNEKLISIAAEMNNKSSLEYGLSENEKLGFVYPVYAWQPPAMVIDFVKKMNISNYRNNYIFSVSTCGDDEGHTTGVLKKTLSQKGLKLNSGFTVPMPNNYIISFDVDSKEVEQKKLARADELLLEINSVIDKRQDGVFKIIKGTLPFSKSFIVNPLFRKFATNTKKFFATDDCKKCGLCVKVCNSNSITLKDKPVWGKACTQCLACIHRCPASAIQYGKSTAKKGRYVNPGCYSNQE